MAKAIVLAAGENYNSDDTLPRVLLKHPSTSKTILESFIDEYDDVVFVLGYQALSILNEYPGIQCVINDKWSSTKSAYSLLQAVPHFEDSDTVDVYPSDIFFNKVFFRDFKSLEGNSALCISYRESRHVNAVNLNICTKTNKILSSYKGAIKSIQDPEAIGVFKVNILLLKKMISTQTSDLHSLYATDLITPPFLQSFDLFDMSDNFSEISNAFDMLNLMRNSR